MAKGFERLRNVFSGDAALRREALKKSFPLILMAEGVLAILLVALYFIFSTATDTAGAEKFDPGKAPAVDWPEAEVYSQESAVRGSFQDLPWEVSDGRGAVILPDVFYSDDFQNEQIMPTRLELRLGSGRQPFSYRIDRLIYPTIGNPSLCVRESKDELRVVLRLKRPDYAHLSPLIEPAGVAWAPHLQKLSLEKADAQNRISIYLLNRDQRAITESFRPAPSGPADSIEIKPVALFLHDPDRTPVPLRGRDTIQFVFDTAALAKLKPGLYDLRLEIFQNGRMQRHEFQYNAVRIFDRVPDRYSILNLTDSQVSLSEILDGVPNQKPFKAISLDKLKRFVAHTSRSGDDLVKNAAFITFNGDLHNGGSPGTLMPGDVAPTYNREAAEILSVLRELTIPIFLTPGNHDGYVSMGHVPAPIRLKVASRFFLSRFLGQDQSLQEVVEAESGPEHWQRLSQYLAKSGSQPGGWHRDVFGGRFIRRGRVDEGGAFTWRLVPEGARNTVLYDGFYQWQHAYGPLFYSFHFGRNHFVVLNTYDLRQHRRSGWGMYTVNYGGGVSPFQMNWLRRDLYANEAAARDITLIAHHDPRGGHNGEDYPYYFEMIEYTGMGESASNYVKGEILNPMRCGNTPDWAVSKGDVLSCMHDGLQEWMRADPDFDCADEDLITEGPRAGFCDTAKFKSQTFAGNPRRPEYSGYQLLHRLAKHPRVRTLLLGHTHYNALEMLQPGDEIVPGQVTLDLTADRKYAKIEVENPMRRGALEDLERAGAGGDAAEKKPEPVATPGEKQGELEKIKIVERNGVPVRVLDLLKSGHDFERKLNAHELAILRMTSVADLSLQTFQDRPLYGFSVFEIYPRADRRAYPQPQINGVHYFQARSEAANPAAAYEKVASVELNRTTRWKQRQENPLLKLFRLPGWTDEAGEKASPAVKPERTYAPAGP